MKNSASGWESAVRCRSNIERLGQLVDMGVDFFMTALPMPERKVFAAEIMPAVRAARY